ncbi:hypothetical protein HZA97_08570 [Candidatus Woesearchaeota archaeon]|nr:hypothetical protein [Candidatus Woesearchaeota archaeon]
MAQKEKLEVKYLSPDGRYIGGVCNTKLVEKTKIKFAIPDNNNLEHIVQGVIVSVADTDKNLYSYLMELDPPAPQRVRDFHLFNKTSDCDVGSVTKTGTNLYTASVLFVGLPFDITIDNKETGESVNIVGTVLSEETKKSPKLHKYFFKLKFDKELTEEELKKLKKLDVD